MPPDTHTCSDRWWIDGAIGPAYVVGCGAVFSATPDAEGLVDCPTCGMFFATESTA